jgi:hypothetical protein
LNELLAHLFGDYILQTHKQAMLKRSRLIQAIVHAATYTLPFLLLTRRPIPLLIIFGTHAIIDHYGLARYVVRLKNSLGDWKERALYDTSTGYPEDCPAWLKTWLLIVADNTLHLAINHFSLMVRI